MQKMYRIFVVSILAVVLLGSGTAFTDVKPVQLSLWDTVQLYPSSTKIQGLRLSVYGVNSEVVGVDFGIVPRVTGNMTGWQGGVVNLVEGNMVGFQDGFVNKVDGTFLGWQRGFVNVTKGEFTGLQTAIVNKAGTFNGLQLSVVNMADTLNGLQIGIINLNFSGNPYKFLPIVNFSF